MPALTISWTEIPAWGPTASRNLSKEKPTSFWIALLQLAVLLFRLRRGKKIAKKSFVKMSKSDNAARCLPAIRAKQNSHYLITLSGQDLIRDKLLRITFPSYSQAQISPLMRRAGHPRFLSQPDHPLYCSATCFLLRETLRSSCSVSH